MSIATKANPLCRKKKLNEKTTTMTTFTRINPFARKKERNRKNYDNNYKNQSLCKGKKKKKKKK